MAPQHRRVRAIGRRSFAARTINFLLVLGFVAVTADFSRSFVGLSRRLSCGWATSRAPGVSDRARTSAWALGLEVFELITPPADALNANSAPGLRGLVWADFYFAVAFFVLTPLGLLFWSLWSSIQSTTRNDEVLRVMVGYWQASSLLLITVLLNIAGLPIGTTTGFVAQLMIPLSLWFWEDLNDRIDKQGSVLANTFKSWRVVATVGAILGVVCLIPYQYCATVTSLSGDAGCAAWIEAPLAFCSIFLSFVESELCGTIGMAGLTIYIVYCAYLLVAVLPEIGRRGLQPRSMFTWIAPLEWLDLVSVDDQGKDGTSKAA